MDTISFDTLYTKYKGSDAIAWKAKIIEDLKGKKFEQLITQVEDEIEIYPIYTIEDLEKYQLAIPSLVDAECLNTSLVSVEEVVAANKKALEFLKQGAQSIIFDLKHQPFTSDELQQLIENIYTDVAPIYFDNFLPEYKTVLENNLPKSSITKIDVPQQQSKINELLFALYRIFYSDEESFRVHLVIGQNFFLEIAKLRAFRWLVEQLNTIHQTKKEIILIAETGFENRSDETPENNILRNTTEAISAVLGGVQGILVHAHENSNLGYRIAKNVKNIIDLESHLSTSDALTKGSYYIEYLTYQLAQKTWEKL